MSAKIVPNTFQTFNAYIDRAMIHLTDAEFRVLMYATRHIMGWQDKINSRMGYISLEMFENGFNYTDEDGEELHFAGCGLRRNAISKALGSLCEFGFLERVGKPTEKGQQWRLVAKPQWQKLEARSAEIAARNQKRLTKANEALAAKKANPPLPVSSDDTIPSDDMTLVSSHDTQPVSSDEHKQNQVQNQYQNDALPTSPKVLPLKPRNEWYDAIQKTWGYTAGLNNDIEKMLRGTATKGEYKTYRLEQPLQSPPELLEWKDWYFNVKNNGRKDVILVSKLTKIQSSIGEWQVWKTKGDSAKPQTAPDDNEVPDDWGAEHFVREANDVA